MNTIKLIAFALTLSLAPMAVVSEVQAAKAKPISGTIKPISSTIKPISATIKGVIKFKKGILKPLIVKVFKKDTVTNEFKLFKSLESGADGTFNVDVSSVGIYRVTTNSNLMTPKERMFNIKKSGIYKSNFIKK